MRTTTTLLLMAGGLAALVSSPQSASADTVPFASLPVTPALVKIPTSTSNAPDKVLAGEHVDGLYPALLPMAKRKKAEDEGSRVVTVFTNEKEAQTFATDGSTLNNPLYESTAPRTCLSRWGSMTTRAAFSFRTKPYVAPKPTPAQIQQLIKMHRWPPKPAPKPVKPAKVEAPKDNVYPIHIEHLSAATDSVTLDVTDAFIDLQTMGVRLVSKTSEKLTRVAAGPNGMGVYAARDDKGKSEFLVTSPDLPAPSTDADREAQVASLASAANRLLAQIPNGTESTGCGYIRFALEVKPGTGQMATVLANAFLPPAADPSDADSAEPPPDPSDSDDDDGENARMQMEEQARANRSQRSRPVAVNVSVSQLTSEPAPLLSVTFGWAGKDQRLAF